MTHEGSRRVARWVALPRARPLARPLAWAAALTIATVHAPDATHPWPGIALGRAGTPAETATAAAADTRPEPKIPLPEIPELEPLVHRAPDPTAVKEVEGRLAELLETKVSGPLDPKFDMAPLTRGLGPEEVGALAQRVQELRSKLDGAAAEALLERARKEGRKALKKQKRAGEKVDDDGDWLLFVLALERPTDQDWRDVTQLYAVLRMLESIGTTAAVRQMIDCYSYFGELVRIDIQRAIARLGDRSVAALIEARKHDTGKVARWANRMLDELGRAIAGEAVSSSDPEVLADVLRAFGRTRDVDAVRVILSFCGSDRVGLRTAAREAVGAIGEPATWQLREAYQQLSGDKPPRGWDWNRLAREIFRLHDQARLAEVYRLADEGMRALTDGQFGRAAAAFDQVLARQPLFSGRAEMAPAYVGLAKELEDKGQRADALAALRKALRLRPSHADNAKVESRIAYLEALDLVEAGTPDRYLLERALELDPANEDARTLLGSLEQRAVKRRSQMGRYVAAAAIGLVALLGMGFVALWPKRRSRKRTTPGSTEPTADERSRQPNASLERDVAAAPPSSRSNGDEGARPVVETPLTESRATPVLRAQDGPPSAPSASEPRLAESEPTPTVEPATVPRPEPVPPAQPSPEADQPDDGEKSGA